MILFADASALIAIIAGDPEAADLADRLEAARERLCSPLCVWETVAGLCRSYTFAVLSARAHARRFLTEGDFRFVPIGEREYEIATDAYARYGRGRHPAALNTGDCFSYACTRANGARLLFKGDDFSRTDIEAA